MSNKYLKSVKARAGHNATDAWFYKNKKTIEVYIYAYGKSISCYIKKSQLKKWVMEDKTP